MICKKAHIILLLLALFWIATPVAAKGKGTRFFYQLGQWIDNFTINGLDTNYICLPEHSWRVAYTNSVVGISTEYVHTDAYDTHYRLLAKAEPSVELGFNISCRNLGFGYAWDVRNAYARNLNFSFGGKSVGIEFSRQYSTNINGQIFIGDSLVEPKADTRGKLWITNTTLSGWFVLNSTHYSHNAAIKQGYIQRKTAGSLLLSLSYHSTILEVKEEEPWKEQESSIMMGYDDATDMWTQQIAVGLGYGINYTPNKGKVLLHASGSMQLVCYSINHIGFIVPDYLPLPGKPYYSLKPDFPVYVTGNFRVALSWEINKWVHLNVWGQAQNLRFKTAEANIADIKLNNWNWHAHASIAVRFGAGKKRTSKVLEEHPLPERFNNAYVAPRPTKIPQWVTDFFFSPR